MWQVHSHCQWQCRRRGLYASGLRVPRGPGERPAPASELAWRKAGPAPRCLRVPRPPATGAGGYPDCAAAFAQMPQSNLRLLQIRPPRWPGSLRVAGASAVLVRPPVVLTCSCLRHSSGPSPSRSNSVRIYGQTSLRTTRAHQAQHDMTVGAKRRTRPSRGPRRGRGRPYAGSARRTRTHSAASGGSRPGSWRSTPG